MAATSSMSTDSRELVSVIVPVYNIEGYISRCLECISSQTYRDLEIILVDDGSDDGSGRILDEFAQKDARARVIRHESNLGPSAARNSGLDAATGAYVWFPDGDDYFHRDIVMILHEAINKDGGYDVALCGWSPAYGRDEDIESVIIPQYSVLSRESYFSYVLDKNADVWNKLYRATAIEGVRFKPYPLSQVRDFNLRAIRTINNAIRVENCMYYWFQRPGSISKAPGAGELYLSCICDMYYEMFPSFPKSMDHFQGTVLRSLFHLIIKWKLSVEGRPDKDLVYERCRMYERNARRPYLLNRWIGTREKAVCMFLVHNPRLACRLHSRRESGRGKGLAVLRYKTACTLLRYASV